MAAATMNERRKVRKRLALPALIALALATGCGRREEPPLAGAAIGGPFTLTDQNGRRVSERDFAGRYRIVYFGYTHCPDVCPTDLATISQALARLDKSDPDKAAKLKPLFITVDPERDTPSVMKEYLASFDRRIEGLTGTAAEIAAAEKRFIVYARKGPLQPGGGYAMDHSRQVLLMGPKGEPVALLPDDGVEAMAKEIKRWVA
jgi:protein SCO1/2